jgi:hypothetical protein
MIGQLREAVLLPLLRPDLFTHSKLLRPTRGILLHGPPGTGKTVRVRGSGARTQRDGRPAHQHPSSRLAVRSPPRRALVRLDAGQGNGKGGRVRVPQREPLEHAEQMVR